MTKKDKSMRIRTFFFDNDDIDIIDKQSRKLGVSKGGFLRFLVRSFNENLHKKYHKIYGFLYVEKFNQKFLSFCHFVIFIIFHIIIYKITVFIHNNIIIINKKKY